MKKSSSFVVFSLILSLGLVASAFILGHQFKNFRPSGVISVKGLAEVEHKATVATWPVVISSTGENYAEALKKNHLNFNQAVQFLEKQGFSKTDFEITDLTVSPYVVVTYDMHGNRREQQDGYTSKREIILSTKNLSQLQKAIEQSQLVSAENQDIYFTAPKYYLEQLEVIKRDLIAQATEDAYARAEQFAKTSKARVGALRSASQGSFDIKSARPDSEDNSDYGGGYDTTTIEKKVRLVVTIEYAID